MLSRAAIEKAKTLYSGAFLRRYIYGEWVAADGLVYPMFDDENVMAADAPIGKCFVSIDYGTHNPCSMGLWNVYDGAAYRIREFYYDSVAAKRQLTDEEYYDRLVLLCKDMPVKSVIVDPSALSFITLIRRRGEYNVIPAKNDVGDGIRLCSSLISAKKLKIASKCKDILREFSLYCWDETADFDKVKKVNDHAMDDMRYFCATILKRNDEFSAKDKDITFSDYFGDLFG